MPARRGMRASWFRGRAPHDLEGRGAEGEDPPPDAPAPDPTGEPTALPPTTPAAPAPTTAVSVRPAFGHPTF